MAELFRNLSGRQRCPYCGDDGQVVVDSGTPEDLRRAWVETVRTKTGKLVDGKLVVDRKLRAQLMNGLPVRGEQMGPCPSCERGNVLEFPPDKSGPWGPDGYWRGRDPGDLEVRDDRPAPPPVEVREFLDRITAGVKTL